MTSPLCFLPGRCACSRQSSAKGGVWASAWRTEFMKQVFPKFCSPAPTGRMILHFGEIEFSGKRDLGSLGVRFLDFWFPSAPYTVITPSTIAFQTRSACWHMFGCHGTSAFYMSCRLASERAGDAGIARPQNHNTHSNRRQAIDLPLTACLEA